MLSCTKHTKLTFLKYLLSNCLKVSCEMNDWVLKLSLPWLLGDGRMMQLKSGTGAQFRNSHFEQLNSVFDF